MVAIFTGAGAGFTRGSANLLGGIGQLGGGLLGWGSENVSVNAATGNLVVSHQDEFLVGRGPDVGISRTYNSLGDASDGDNGDSWQQSTTRRVFGLTGSVDTAGSTISGAGVAAAGISQAFYTYDQAGRLLAQYNAGETNETFVYDGMGRLVASTDVHGGTTTIVFNNAALTTTVTTASGYASTSTYNRAGELISRTDSGVNTTVGTATNQYDKNGRLRIATDDLVQRLVREAGRILEDASLEFAMALPAARDNRTTRLTGLQNTCAVVSALMEAAVALDRQASDEGLYLQIFVRSRPCLPS